MNESILVDLRYAIGQLRPVAEGTVSAFSFDRAQRALDALERVEEALSGPDEQLKLAVDTMAEWTAADVQKALNKSWQDTKEGLR